MGTTKLENNHMKKYMEFVLSNFVIIAFVVLLLFNTGISYGK